MGESLPRYLAEYQNDQATQEFAFAADEEAAAPGWQRDACPPDSAFRPEAQALKDTVHEAVQPGTSCAVKCGASIQKKASTSPRV